MDFGGSVLPWTRHVRAGRDLVRRAFEAANKIGDLTCAAYCGNQTITNFLAAGDPLAEAQREAEHGLAFAQKARFGTVIDAIAAQLALIRTLRGLTPRFGCFDDAGVQRGADRAPFLRQSRLGLRRVLVLDPQAPGAFLCRRLRLGPGGLIEGATGCCGPLFHSSRRPNITSTPRCLEPPPAIPQQPASGAQHLDAIAAHHQQLGSGRRIARRISRTAPRWSPPRSRAWRAATLEAETLVRTGHPLGPRQRLYSQGGARRRTRRPLLRGAWASRRSRICICATRATAI